ncbi:monocarboxylate transporter 12-like [Varroa jacobsoni]|uniref:monocarboxylate transporter 12-like n=1 Tax=Varroa jacobsoni TaxID=62625 RepID=UPI000BF8FC80|nr:monocarboxylate transporter 12-like [Varroa jacobsoni]
MLQQNATSDLLNTQEKNVSNPAPKCVSNNDNSESSRRKGPDGPESIRIGVYCLFVAFLCSAGFRSAGFLYMGIMDTYIVSHKDASWPLSVIGAITNLAGVIAGPLCQRYPTRPVMCCGAVAASAGMILSFWAQNIAQLTLSLGILYGFGCGVVFTGINVALSQHFDKYRAVAYGVVYAGSTMASFVFPNLLLALSLEYSFRNVLLIFGGIITNMFALALCIKEPSWTAARPSKTIEQKDSVKKATIREAFDIFRKPIFYVLLVSNIFFQYGFDAFMTTLVDFAVERGATLQQAVNLLPWFSAADVVGRGLFPIMADRGLIDRTKFIMTCYILTGVFTLLLPATNTYTELILCILLMGSFCGCAAVMFLCVVSDIIGVSRFPLAIGTLGLTNGGFYFTKPFFFGYFCDVVQSYDGMFHMTGTLTLFVGLVWLCIIGSKRSRKHSFFLGTSSCCKFLKVLPVQDNRNQLPEVTVSAINLQHNDNLKAQSSHRIV